MDDFEEDEQREDGSPLDARECECSFCYDCLGIRPSDFF